MQTSNPIAWFSSGDIPQWVYHFQLMGDFKMPPPPEGPDLVQFACNWLLAIVCGTESLQRHQNNPQEISALTKECWNAFAPEKNMGDVLSAPQIEMMHIMVPVKLKGEGALGRTWPPFLREER